MKLLFHCFNKAALLFFLTLLVSCGDFRGASQPFSYAPETAQSLWIPPKSFRKDIIPFDHETSEEMADKKLTLAEVIDIALINNPETKRSWSQAREAAANYGISLKKYFVLSDIDANYYRQREAMFFGSGGRGIVYETFYGGELDLKYTILDFGQTRATSQAALQSLYAADLSHNRQLQTVVRSAMNDYYDYLSQKALVKASKQNVLNAEVALDAVNEKFNSGVADMSDKVQATTKLLQQKLDLIDNKKQLSTKYTILLKQLGLNSNIEISFEDYPDDIKLYTIDFLDNLINLAINNRPDLQSYEAQLASAKQELKLALAKRYPTIDGSFQFGRQYTNLTLSDHYDFKGEISFNYPLFQGFFIENNIKKARAKLEKSEADLREKQLQLIQEVSQYADDVSYSREAYIFSKQFLESAQLDFDINLQEYKTGTATIVELINAQTSVADAAYKLVNSEKNWYTSIANMAYATGVLTNNPEKDVNPQKTLKKARCFNLLDEKDEKN